MTFTPGEPQNGESLGASKPKVRNNLDGLRASLAVNHVDINGGVDNGKHKFMQMPEQGIFGTATPPATGTNIGGLFSMEYAGFTNLVWRQETGGANASLNQGGITPLTGPLPFQSGGGGFTYLPGGLLVNYGQVLGATDQSDFLWPSQNLKNIPYTTFITCVVSQYNTSGELPLVFEIAPPTPPDTLLTKYKIRIRNLNNTAANGSYFFIAIGYY